MNYDSVRLVDTIFMATVSVVTFRFSYRHELLRLADKENANNEREYEAKKMIHKEISDKTNANLIALV